MQCTRFTTWLDHVYEAISRRVLSRLCLPSEVGRHVEYIRRRPAFMADIRDLTLRYVLMNSLDESPGHYSFKVSGPSLLYASCYAVLVRHLFGDLEALSPNDKMRWAEYIQNYQNDDGLFRDPLIACPLAEISDWWGWRHLSLHSLMALAVVGAVAEKPFCLLEPFKRRGEMVRWLESRTWDVSAANVSNEVQNYGTFLQYSRDFQGQSWCQEPLEEMYKWLDKTQDKATGLWGKQFEAPYDLSLGVQTGYHIWMLYFYDKRPIKCEERIIDSCLATQNRLGGFGVMLNSSACEDIDSVDLLSRFYQRTDYRRSEIEESLTKTLPWILTNQNEDGGWVFRRYGRFSYGHPLMTTGPQESSLFSTWFRCLTLAYLFQVLDQPQGASINWRFLDCPGHQFFHRSEKNGERL